MELSNLTLMLTVIVSVVFTLTVFFLFKYLKKAKYDKDNNKAVLDSIRHSFETQIYSLNDRLVQSEERWKDVNHLLLRNEYIHNDSPLKLDQKIFYSDFLRANGITENDLIIDSRLIFVLTPFHDRYSEDYRIIKDVCISSGYKCLRGDEIYVKGDIFPEMLRLIIQSSLIIANIDGRNSNVMYELGIAQALNKAVILIAKNPSEIPFNIRSKRFIIYENYNDLTNTLRKELLNVFKKQ